MTFKSQASAASGELFSLNVQCRTVFSLWDKTVYVHWNLVSCSFIKH